MTDGDFGHGHDSRYCDASKRAGDGTCTRPAGWGTDHPGYGACKLHGGNTASHRVRSQRDAAAAQAATAVATYGLPVTVDPRDALLEEVHRTAGAVQWLESRVRELAPDDITWGATKREESTMFGTSEEQAARVSIWVQLYQQERKHLVDVCKAAAAAGIEERRVQLAEQQGELLANVISGILDDLSLTPDQSVRAADIVTRHLTAAAAAA